ncbi:MAG: hypothetical protein AB1630_10520 [bacterium]
MRSVGSSVAIQGFPDAGHRRPKLPEFLSFLGADGVDLSAAGKLLSAMSNMTGKDKVQMKAFREEMHQAMMSGNFDVEKMAERAPNVLKTFAKENGIDLKDTLNTLTELRKMGPPPLSGEGGPQGKGGPPQSGPQGGPQESESMIARGEDVVLRAIIEMMENR